MSTMSDKLLETLNAVSARDQVADENTQKAMRPGVDYDETTGEWLQNVGESGDEGYQYEEPPSLKEVAQKESKVPDFENSDATEDYKRVRDTTYAMQEATMFMLGQAAKLAASTEAPRAFSVFRELGELMRGLNKDLMDNQKSFKAVTSGEEKDEPTVEVKTSPDGSSTVTVGKPARSSRDLLQVIEKARQEEAKRMKEKTTIDQEAEVVEPNTGENNGNSEA